MNTNGSLHEDGIDIEFDGACPVQGFGTIDAFPVYYRARGEHATIEVWPRGTRWGGEEELRLPDSDGCFFHASAPYPWPDAGWLTAEESVAFIRVAAAAFRASTAWSPQPVEAQP